MQICFFLAPRCASEQFPKDKGGGGGGGGRGGRVGGGGERKKLLKVPKILEVITPNFLLGNCSERSRKRLKKKLQSRNGEKRRERLVCVCNEIITLSFYPPPFAPPKMSVFRNMVGLVGKN